MKKIIPNLFAVAFCCFISASLFAAEPTSGKIPSVSNWIVNNSPKISKDADADSAINLLQEYEGQISSLTHSMKSKMKEISQDEKAGRISAQQAEILRRDELRSAATTLDMVNGVYAGLFHSIAKDETGPEENAQIF